MLNEDDYNTYVEDVVNILTRRWNKMKKEIAKALKELEDVWDEPAAKGGARLPDFDGAAKITEMSFELSSNNKPMVVTTFAIVEPEKFEGREIKRFDMISKAHWPFFKGFAEQIGLELPDAADPNDVEAAISEFIENIEDVFSISVTKDGDFNRIAIIDDNDDDEDDDEDEDKDDDKTSKGKKAGKKAKDEDEDEDEDGDEGDDTEKRAELVKLNKKHKLGVKVDDYDDIDDLEKAIKAAAKKKKVKI